MEAHDRWEKGMRSILVCCFFAVLIAGSVFATQPNVAPPETAASTIAAPAAPSGQIASPQAPGTVPQSEDSITTRQRINEALLQSNFSYFTNKSVDPFIPFVSPQQGRPPGAVGGEEDIELPPEQQKPMTPLQKMSLGEIEKGLKAIVWGQMGRKAVIEDGAGKGYIVTIGTPVGDKNGMVLEIFNDRLVVKQDVWDQKLKRMLVQNSTVKLKKEKEK